jgi:hypothetical protein
MNVILLAMLLFLTGVAHANPEARRFLQQEVAAGRIDPANPNQTFHLNNQRFRVGDFEDAVTAGLFERFGRIGRAQAKQLIQNYLVGRADVLHDRSSPQRAELLEGLGQLYDVVHGDRGAEELTKGIECLPPATTQERTVADLLAGLRLTERVDGCRELAPGQHRMFTRDPWNQYGTADYLLKRTADGNYQAVLNVNFRAGGGTTPPGEMLRRTQQCLQLASTNIRGPGNQRLELLVVGPEEVGRLPASERPAANDVTIEPPGFRANARAYGSDIPCPVIVHEVLHLLGLCDEYPETAPDMVQHNWTCRVLTEAPSVMRDLTVFERAIPASVTCDCASPLCRRVMSSSNEDLKQLYVGQTLYDVVPHEFRIAHCQDRPLPTGGAALAAGGRSVLVQSQRATGFTLEGRSIWPGGGATVEIQREQLSCECPAGNAGCLAEVRRIVARASTQNPRRGCPNDLRYVPFDPVRPNQSPGYTLQGDRLTLVSPAQLPSVLQPNHFYKILEGACPGGRSAGYQECAAFAYKSPPCNVPDRCRDDEYYLGVGQ